MRGKESQPTSEGLDQMSADKAYIYRFQPPEGLKVPLLVHLASINDETLSEAEIEMAVQGLKGGIFGGLSGMGVEDLKVWLREAKRENCP